MRTLPYRAAAWLVLGAAGVVIGPAACLFPNYTFNEGEGGSGGSTSATTSSSSSSTSGNTSTSSSSSSSSGAVTEDCTNGVDDDNDGDADCADSDCMAYQCVPAVPDGWQGPFVLYDGPAAGFPQCPGNFPGGDPGINEIIGGAGVPSPAPQAMCTCSCDPPASPTCKPPSQLTVLDASCANQASANCGALPNNPANWNGSCGFGTFVTGGVSTCGANSGAQCDMGSAACNVSVSSTGPTVTGTCTPQHTETIPQVDFVSAVHACGGADTSTAGCSANTICAPRAPAPFNAKLCVYVNGDTTCTSAAPYLVKHSGATTIDTSQLKCSACNCGALTGGSCKGDIEVYSDNVQGVCGSLITTFQAGTCKDLPGNPTIGNRKFVNTTIMNPGSCAPSGGQPQGVVQTTGKFTICCQQ